MGLPPVAASTHGPVPSHAGDASDPSMHWTRYATPTLSPWSTASTVSSTLVVVVVPTTGPSVGPFTVVAAVAVPSPHLYSSPILTAAKHLYAVFEARPPTNTPSSSWAEATGPLHGCSSVAHSAARSDTHLTT